MNSKEYDSTHSYISSLEEENDQLRAQTTELIGCIRSVKSAVNVMDQAGVFDNNALDAKMIKNILLWLNEALENKQ